MHRFVTSRGAVLQWGLFNPGAALPVPGAGSGVAMRAKSGWTLLARRTPILWQRPRPLDLDAEPPVLVGSITVGAATLTTIDVTWPAGADNVGVTSYEVRVGGTGAWTDVGNTTSYTFSGLAAGTTYLLEVRAKDAAGNVSTPALSVAQSTTSPVIAPVGNSRPVLDVSTGNWTPSVGTSLYATIDEVVEDNADYIRCVASPTIEVGVVQILPVLGPGTHPYRFAASVTGGVAQIRVSLLDDSNTVLATGDWTPVTNGVALYEATLTIAGTATRARIEGQGT